MRMPKDIIVIDLEADGKPVNETRITEIGAVRLDKNTLAVVKEFSVLVKLPHKLDQFIVSLTHITDEMLEKDGKEPRVAMREFTDWCGFKGGVYLGAWGAYYDIPVLRNNYVNFAGLPYPFPGSALDIKAIAWWETMMQNHPTTGGLGRTAKRLGLKVDESARHRALYDARLTAEVLQACLKIRTQVARRTEP